MNCYEIWTDLRPGVRDQEFVRDVQRYLGHLAEAKLMASYRIKRRKLGFGPDGLGEWHLSLEFEDLRQLEDAFDVIAKREGPVEDLHHAVYSKVTNLKFGLYRDFPDLAQPCDPEG